VMYFLDQIKRLLVFYSWRKFRFSMPLNSFSDLAYMQGSCSKYGRIVVLPASSKDREEDHGPSWWSIWRWSEDTDLRACASGQELIRSFALLHYWEISVWGLCKVAS
jgi:hypothetical protein